MKITDFQVRTKATATPTGNKIIMHAGPGVGKTSFWAHAPAPLFIPAQGEESGIAKLAEAGLIPESTQWIPEVRLSSSADSQNDGWLKLLDILVALAREEHEYKTVVLDCFDEEGFLSMAYRYHGDQHYGGKMGLDGFENFGKGYQSVISEVKRVTHGALNAITRKGIDVVLIMHTGVTNFKNPDGSDYHRFSPQANQKHVWPLLSGWADMVLFSNFDTFILEKDGERAKAKGGKARVLHTQHAATHEAKNRHGLPATIKLPENPADSYAAFAALLKKG